MDITYNEVVSFLEIVRPGGERLVDQLMISEDLSGSDLRAMAREYISILGSLEVLYSTRQSSLFDIMAPELKKSIIEVETEVESIKEELVKIKTKRSKPSADHNSQHLFWSKLD